MTLVNTAFAKPNYQLHRTKVGAPVAIDNADLTVLKTITVEDQGDGITSLPRRDLFDAGGWRTVRGVVSLTGGTSIALIPLELAALKAADGTVTQQFVPLAAAITGLGDGATFTATINGGRLFMRISVVTGAVTLAEVYLAGAEAMNVLPGSHRQL